MIASRLYDALSVEGAFFMPFLMNTSELYKVYRTLYMSSIVYNSVHSILSISHMPSIGV